MKKMCEYIAQAGKPIKFKCEGSIIATAIPEQSMKLYIDGLVVEDGIPYCILSVGKDGEETIVSLVYWDHYQIHYSFGKAIIYTSDENWVDEEDEASE